MISPYIRSFYSGFKRLTPEPVEDFVRTRIVNLFHRIWYNATDSWQRNTYMGYPVLQIPMDLWLYQELIFRERPACILQTGVAEGGSLLYFAHLLDLTGAPASCLVIGVDITLSPKAQTLRHGRIRLVEGDSTAPEVIARLEELRNGLPALVILDSDHRRDHVLRELERYHHMVPAGGCLVVEDTNVNGHPVYHSHGPGPFEAVEEFLSVHDDFIRDDGIWKRNLLSFHQYGWLRRRANSPRAS